MSSLAQELLRASLDEVETGPDPAAGAIADAALRQFELFGIDRTTIDDVAKRAKVARVTVYRHFPGREALVQAVILREVRRFLADLDGVLSSAGDLDDRLVEGFVFVIEAIQGHRLLQRMLASEPESVLPHLTVDGAPFIDTCRAYLVARLVDDIDEDRSPEQLAVVAEVMIRLLMSFLLTPSTTIDLSGRNNARAFALRYLRPILDA